MVKNINEPEGWKETFAELNGKLGNNVWGARLEGSDDAWTTIRVYVNKRSFIEKVSKETGDVIAGLPLVYTIFSQKQHASLEAERNK